MLKYQRLVLLTALLLAALPGGDWSDVSYGAGVRAPRAMHGGNSFHRPFPDSRGGIPWGGGFGNAYSGWPNLGGFWGAWGDSSLGWFPWDRLPYYAVFPPVYYRYPMGPTSGYGSWPGTAGANVADAAPVEPLIVHNPYVASREADVSEAAPVKPLIVRNPYVASHEADVSEASDTRVGPLFIRNPFVDQAAETAPVDKTAVSSSSPIVRLSLPNVAAARR